MYDNYEEIVINIPNLDKNEFDFEDDGFDFKLKMKIKKMVEKSNIDILTIFDVFEELGCEETNLPIYQKLKYNRLNDPEFSFGWKNLKEEDIVVKNSQGILSMQELITGKRKHTLIFPKQKVFQKVI